MLIANEACICAIFDSLSQLSTRWQTTLVPLLEDHSLTTLNTRLIRLARMPCISPLSTLRIECLCTRNRCRTSSILRSMPTHPRTRTTLSIHKQFHLVTGSILHLILRSMGMLNSQMLPSLRRHTLRTLLLLRTTICRHGSAHQ